MVGEINKNTNGTAMMIIAERNHEDMDVEFLDDYHYIKQHVTYVNFQRGHIKNPYDKVVFGMGYLGIGKKATDDKESYNCWWNMLERCYNSLRSDLHPSYFGISQMSSEWLNFQTFTKWFEENRYETEGRLHIDKDIKYPGNKIYSPYHCILVPQRINMLFTNKPNNRGLPNGISKTKSGRYAAKYNKDNLGIYDTVEEAYEVYAKAKKDTIIQIAEEYKNKIPTELYNAMLNYEVKIENDKNWVAA